jgi:hypothetical protein
MKILVRQWLLWSVILLVGLWLLSPIAGFLAVCYLPVSLVVTFAIVVIARTALG